jgi:hypothetical protein
VNVIRRINIDLQRMLHPKHVLNVHKNNQHYNSDTKAMSAGLANKIGFMNGELKIQTNSRKSVRHTEPRMKTKLNERTICVINITQI